MRTGDSGCSPKVIDPRDMNAARSSTMPASPSEVLGNVDAANHELVSLLDAIGELEGRADPVTFAAPPAAAAAGGGEVGASGVVWGTQAGRQIGNLREGISEATARVRSLASRLAI